MTVTPYAPAIWAEMRIWSVDPHPTGGFLVVCDGRPVNWFKYESRALNEAQKLNQAEMLRLQRMKEAGQ